MNTPIRNKFALGFPWKTQDPFLFCVYHLDHYPKGNPDMGPATSLEGRNLGNDFEGKDGWNMYHGQTVPGFPYHPHRGFETITMAERGYCDHSDSLGAAGRFGKGDVQWMTAGRGVQHSEMFPLLYSDRENTLELFQIWLNLPADKKFADPHFKMLWHEDIPIIEDNGTRVKVVCGGYKEALSPKPAPESWAADPANEVAIWTIGMDPNSSITLPKASPHVNRTLYFYEGAAATLAGDSINRGLGFDLDPASEIRIENKEGISSFLLLQGKPIDEPVAKYGPFVMNTNAEIQQAMEEYRLTHFGGWPWPHPDNVHGKNDGRFALYPDGTRVNKEG
jgi:redox-sensitive bicupin YhaK (pirin superfamily)